MNLPNAARTRLPHSLPLVLCAYALLFPFPVSGAPGTGWSDEPDAGEEIGGDRLDEDPMGCELSVLDDAAADGAPSAAPSTAIASLLLRITADGGQAVGFSRAAAEMRSVYRSDRIDAAVMSGVRRTLPEDASGRPLTERYTVFSVAAPWASAGRLEPPCLYRALAESFTVSADLSRMSPEPPLLIRSDLPSFSAGAGVMNRFALHPLGDALVAWAGSSPADAREAALFVRVRPARALSLELLAAAAAPAVEDFSEREDAWFPDAAGPALRMAGAGFRVCLYTRPLRVSGSLLASAGPCSDPGAAFSLQLDGGLGPAALRLRAGSADYRFRELRSGLPGTLFAADCRLGIGDDSVIGGEATASVSLRRRPAFTVAPADGGATPQGPLFAAVVRPGPGRPGRERWGAALHAGSDRLQFSAGGRLETEWDGSGGPARLQRLEAALLLGSAAGASALQAIAQARCRVCFAEFRYDETESRLVLGIESGRLQGRLAVTLLCGGAKAAELTPEARAVYQADRIALSLLCEVTRGILLEPPAEGQRRRPLGEEGLPLRLTLSVRIQ